MLPVPESGRSSARSRSRSSSQSQVTFIPSWIKWNYSGFERQGDVADAARAERRAARATSGDPRVVYEHSPDHEALGHHPRLREPAALLRPLDARRALHAGLADGAVRLLHPVGGLERACRARSPTGAARASTSNAACDHLRMMNVSQYIVRSDGGEGGGGEAARARARGAVIGPYEIYRVQDNAGRYAIPLTRSAVLVLGDGWKEARTVVQARRRPTTWCRSSPPTASSPVRSGAVRRRWCDDLPGRAAAARARPLARARRGRWRPTASPSRARRRAIRS